MSRPVAVITGTSSGIGAAITTALIEQGWHVHGLCRRVVSFPDWYSHTICDLSDTASIANAVKTVTSTHPEITALINNAGVGHFAPHEELSTAQIEELVAVNLLAPLLLSKLLLRELKLSQGFLINISSFSAHQSSSFGAAYAATKAGLFHFGTSLFDEVRKSGLKVCTVSPDITRTLFYEHAPFSPEDAEVAAVEPTCVAEAVVNILTQRTGTVITEVVLRPQRLLLKKHPRDHSSKKSA